MRLSTPSPRPATKSAAVPLIALPAFCDIDVSSLQAASARTSATTTIDLFTGIPLRDSTAG